MYWGSVRFFKHLILGFLVLLIAVPVTVCIVLGVQNRAYRAQLGLLEQTEENTGMRAAAAERLDADAPPTPTPTPTPLVPAYQALYPALYAAEGERGTLDPDKTVYLTFDDGPSAQTPEILAILERYGVKATFFASGSVDEEDARQLRAIQAAGHALGVHTYSHDYKKIYASVGAYLDDFALMYDAILAATGTAPAIFRFPGGSVNGYNAGVYRPLTAELARRGFVSFDWTVDAADTAANAKVENVVNRALAGVESRRAVVLLHDSANPVTLSALPAIIEGYRAAGFTFAPLTPQTRPVTLG